MRNFAFLVVCLSSCLWSSAGKEPYDPALASLLLDMSNVAYCGEESVRAWDCKPCKRYHTENTTVITGRFGGFGKTQDWMTQAVVTPIAIDAAGTIGIVVAFRGSANDLNWMEDFYIAKMAPNNDIYKVCPKCRVHSGFYNSWVSLAVKVTAAVKNLQKQYSEAPILVTGHSLGAAQAVLAAVHLYYGERLAVRYVYTYGQPRVGNEAWHQFFNGVHTTNGTAYRITHHMDPVPHLPPKGFLGFVHTATEVFYGNDSNGTHTICDDSGEDRHCANKHNFLSCLSHPQDHTDYLGRVVGGGAC